MAAPDTRKKQRPRPSLLPEYCKGCGRCIDACEKHCITAGTRINPLTGLIPVVFDLEECTGCGLCIRACPEPYALGHWQGDETTRDNDVPQALDIPDETLKLPELEPLLIKGTYASALGAILAGCRHFYGYPITPSTEGAELMALLQPMLDGVFYQAVSEVAAVNMMYGTGAAGLPCMTLTSSPGFSLMLEGISYMIGAELPGVFVNVMRGGPGLGNIAPEQSDIKLMCHGLGHGNTHGIVLAPATPQEMLDLTFLAFELSFKYRNPVIIAADGYLGQITGKVTLPEKTIKPGIPKWAVHGDHAHRGNLISSIQLAETDLENHIKNLEHKYKRIRRNEQRADPYRCDDADIILIACNTPSRMTKGAVSELRNCGIKAGLFRPVTLWPFPIDILAPLLSGTEQIVVVEASTGQLEDELRLILSQSGFHAHPPINSVRRFGGILPQQSDIVKTVRGMYDKYGVRYKA